MSNNDQNKNTFDDTLSEYVRLIKGKHDKNIERDHYRKLLEMIEHNEATLVDVIQAFSRGFSEYPTQKLTLLYLMRAVITTSKMIDSYHYPEFFWIIIQSSLLSEIENINDIMTSLTDIGGYDVVRSYLSYILLTCEESKRLRIIQAFYYTGHTINTIKMVVHLIPMGESSEQEYLFLFSAAMGFLHSKCANILDDDDKMYLKTLFEDGINIFDSSRIIESCQKGLNKIETS